MNRTRASVEYLIGKLVKSKQLRMVDVIRVMRLGQTLAVRLFCALTSSVTYLAALFVVMILLMIYLVRFVLLPFSVLFKLVLQTFHTCVRFGKRTPRRRRF